MTRPLDVIEAEIRKLNEEADAARAEERNNAIARIRVEMERYHISADELRDGTHAHAAETGKSATSGRGAATKKAAAPFEDSSEESPAIRLLEQAGVDFRSKPSVVEPPKSRKKTAPKVARAAASAAVKAAPRKVAAKTAGKGKGGATR